MSLQDFVDKYQFYELLPYRSYHGVLGSMFCSDKSFFQDICASLFFSTGGYSDQFNKASKEAAFFAFCTFVDILFYICSIDGDAGNNK